MSGVGGLVSYIGMLAASAVTRPVDTFELAEELQLSMRRSDYTEAETIKLAHAFTTVYLVINARTNGRVSDVSNRRLRELAELLALTEYKDWQPC